MTSNLYIQGTATLDNATINIGANDRLDEATLYNDGRAGPSVLTLGPNLTVSQVGLNAMLSETAFQAGNGIVNAGTIDAGVSGGSFEIGDESFANQGRIVVSNGDSVTVEPIHSPIPQAES